MSETTVPPRGGLLNVIDVVISPREAFERLRVVPVWGWAFLAALLLAIAGALLMQPAQLHAFEKSGPALYSALPQVQQLPADKQAEMVKRMLGMGRTMMQLTPLFLPFVLLAGILVQSVVMLAANAAVKGDGSFRRFWALSTTVAVVGTGLALLLTGLIATVRGPGGFEAITDVQHALPSLALLAPGAGTKAGAFLGQLNVVSIWSGVLLALGMTVVARFSRPAAIVTATLLVVGAAAFYALVTPAA